jgi:hypothetical protein
MASGQQVACIKTLQQLMPPATPFPLSTQRTQRPCESATSSCRTPYRCTRLSSVAGKLSVCFVSKEVSEPNSNCACRGTVGHVAQHTAVSIPRHRGRGCDWRRRRACDRAHQRGSILQWEQQELLAVLIRATAACQEEQQQHWQQDGCGCAPPQRRGTPAGSTPHHSVSITDSAIRCLGRTISALKCVLRRARLAEGAMAIGGWGAGSIWQSLDSLHPPLLLNKVLCLWVMCVGKLEPSAATAQGWPATASGGKALPRCPCVSR